MSSSMTPNDRESLSALFDGELQGDAARFVLRRLDHDAEWREACSRWQWMGDVMRGQAAGLAPAGFAERVSAALAADAQALAQGAGGETRALAPVAAQAQARRWWGRAALAASVAVAALFVTHPFSGAGPGDVAGVAAGGSVVALPPAPAATATPTLPAPSTPTGGAEMAAVAMAVADVPRRVTERRSRVSAPGVSGSSPRRVEAPTNVAVATVEPAARDMPGEVADPFKPQPRDLVSRPWPRAVLPGATATGALTASFGTTQASPSFYPFTPDASHVIATHASPAPEAAPQP